MKKIIASLFFSMTVAAQTGPIFLPIIGSPKVTGLIMEKPGRPFTDVAQVGADLYVSQQSGEIYKNGMLWATIPVNSTGEAGLNALATDGYRLWMGYTTDTINIARIDTATRLYQVIATFGPISAHHSAAGLLYDNGGLLFGLGDNGNGWTSQSDTLPNGKIWRVDPVTGEKHVVARGLRNPWHITRIGTDVYIADVGESKYEEVNVFRPGSDYGWVCFEGPEPRDFTGDTCESPKVFPLFYYNRGLDRKGIVGVSMLDGKMIYADFSGRVFEGDKVIQFYDGLISKMTGRYVLVFKGGKSALWRF